MTTTNFFSSPFLVGGGGNSPATAEGEMTMNKQLTQEQKVCNKCGGEKKTTEELMALIPQALLITCGAKVLPREKICRCEFNMEPLEF